MGQGRHLYQGKHDYAAAIKALEAFIAVIPSGEDADRARAMIAEAKGRALVSPAWSKPTPRAGQR